jgi:alpha,alpha-trehalose phosphorylase
VSNGEEPAYLVEPWSVTERGFNLANLPASESVFALSNGHIGMRGNLDEGDPHGLPGTYLNSVYELRPLPYAEAGYGYPESGQTVINVTNGKLIRLLVDDEPLDVRYGHLDRHDRTLDLRAGTLSRDVQWRSPAGDTIKVRSTRLVSLTQRAIAAVEYEVEPVDASLRIVLQSELVANEELPPQSKDPRAAAILENPLVSEEHAADGLSGLLIHRTRNSGLRIAAGMQHMIEGPENLDASMSSTDDVCRLTVATRLKPGQKLRLVKYVAYGWSSRRTRPALHDQVVAALAAAKLTGWEGLVAEQQAYLDEYWAGADVEVDGDAEVQQAVRFGLFHLLQSAARAEQRPIPAKGLTGTGYDGHTFWDTETFILPVLTYTHPEAVADALRWRQLILPDALHRAQELGLQGAAFPWRTLRGRESSGYWPAGTAAFHINADLAHAVVRYLDATDDEEFERDVAVELLVHTARLWRSLGQHDADGNFRIDGVTGPDEYSSIADNNVFTNLMAAQNMRAAAEVCARQRDRAAGLGVTTEEMASWRGAADHIVIPYDERLGVHPQSERFTDHARWDFDAMKPGDYPLLLHFPYFDLYRKQVVKQADLVLGMHLCQEAFSDEERIRNFAYYEAMTVRDSSLSACTQATVAAQLGHLDLAHDYLGEAALVDLGDLAHNTRDGIHMASHAGAWQTLVEGFGGMRARHKQLAFAPWLPAGIGRLAFRIRYRGRRVLVTVHPTTATYEVLEGPPLTITHHGEEVKLGTTVATRDIPAPPRLPRPTQPKGREPRRRVPPVETQHADHPDREVGAVGQL